MRYFMYLKDIRENPRKYQDFEDIARELNNPTNPTRILIKKEADKIKRSLDKRFPTKSVSGENIVEFTVIKLVAMDVQRKNSEEHYKYLERTFGKQDTVTALLFKEKVQHPFQKMSEYYYMRHRTSVFYEYINHLERNRELVSSVDNKILKSLNLFPHF